MMRVLDTGGWPSILVHFASSATVMGPDIFLEILKLLIILGIQLILGIQVKILFHKLLDLPFGIFINIMILHQRVKPRLGHKRQLPHTDLVQKWLAWILIELPLAIVLKLLMIVILYLDLF